MPISNLKIIRKPGQGIIVLIGLLFLLALAPALYAATYYVDATGGDDTNNGFSEVTAWKTIAKVNASNFQPGDRIQFKRGEMWRETLVVPSSGAEGMPITFEAYGSGAKPIISAADLTIYSTGNPSSPYASIETSARNNCVAATDKSNIILDNLECKYAKQDGIALMASAAAQAGWTVSNNAVTGAYRRGINTAGTVTHGITGVTIFGNTVSDVGGDTGSNTYSIAVYFADTVTVASNTITLSNLPNNGSASGAIRLYSGVTRADTGSSVHDNTVTGILQQAGISFALSVDEMSYLHIYRNTFTANVDNVIMFDETAPDAYNGPTHCVIYANTIRPGADGSIGILLERSENNSIYYNLLDFTNVTAGNQVVAFWRNSRGNTLYNNTLIYKNDMQAVRLGNTHDPAGDDQRNVKVKNNIFYHLGNTTGSMIAFSDGNGGSPVTTGIEFDYNNYIDPDWPSIVSWFRTNYNSIAAWQTAIGQETHRVEGNPKFVSASDFRLLPSSPCINAGFDVGLPSDYAGILVPQGSAPDIGAYQYQLLNRLAPPANLRININPVHATYL